MTADQEQTVMPPRVSDAEEYWTTHPPIGPSPRCAAWVDRIRSGWRPNRRIGSMGYYESAEFYGVYIWEYIEVIGPMLFALEWPERERSKPMADLLDPAEPISCIAALYECKPDGPQCDLCAMPPDSY